MMTVRELVTLLQGFDQDLEVICTRFSDYMYMKPDEISVVQALPDDNKTWLTRAHPTMTEEDKARVKNYLHFAGN